MSFTLFIAYVIMTIDINITNFTQNWAYYSVQPYINIFGNLFWGMLFGFIGAAIYVSGEGDPRIYLIITGYLIIVGLIFGIALAAPVIAIFGLILTFLVTNIFYKTFVEAK
jgi:hypothetical protein